MMRHAFIFVMLAGALYAQETVAPAADQTVGPARGESVGDYNVVQSWELGYRFAQIAGDQEKYRSDVNFGNGIRLLSSYLTVNSKDGHGKWFDEIVLTTQGLGNDPYESATLRVQKNRLYRYDLHWRSNDYFNPGLTTAEGLHLQNLNQRWQDHDLVLFPDSKVRFKAGFSANNEQGPALSTSNLFEDERGDIFTLFSNVKRVYKSYRVGADFDLAGFKLSVLRRWEYFDDYTPFTAGVETGLSSIDRTTLTNFNRVEPLRGRTPGWLVALTTERSKYAVNGRFTYADGTGNFLLDEAAVGTGFIGTENRLVTSYGTAQRPVLTGDLNLSLFPTDRITITNNTSVDNTRIDGNNFFEQLDLSNLTTSIVNFQFLGVRLITNSTDVHLRLTKKLDLFAGYRYVDREIRSIQSSADPSAPFTNVLYAQSDHVSAGVAGFNWRIAGPLTLHASTEIGRNDNPFYPISEKNYQTIDGRLQYRRKSVSMSAGYKEYYNNNSITLTAYNAHSRTYFANASWNARDWLSLDLGYTKLHLDTAGGIAFFAASTLTAGESVYISNIHAANLGARIAMGKRADLYLGYSITKDTGDGRSSLLPGGTVAGLLYNVQTYPLTFASPLARLTVPITKKIKWNAGYQYYGYNEQFGLYSILQNYHAHTGYTSLLFAF